MLAYITLGGQEGRILRIMGYNHASVSAIFSRPNSNSHSQRDRRDSEISKNREFLCKTAALYAKHDRQYKTSVLQFTRQ
jgi:hypothetical protein